MALSQNKFILSDLSIAVNLSRYEKVLCFLCKSVRCSLYWEMKAYRVSSEIYKV